MAIALRGDSPRYRENTIPALRSAVAHGADAVAVDLRLTADDHVVLVRDEAAREVWGLTRPVRELTLAELAAATSENGQRIPTLMEALAEVVPPRPVALLADVDSVDTALTADAALTDRHFMDWHCTDHVFYSGAREALHALAGHRPGASVVLSWDRGGLPPADQWHGLRPGYLALRHDLLTRELIDEAHRQDLRVSTGPVDDFAEMARLVGMGTDAVITGRVAELAELTAPGRPAAAPVLAPAATRPRGRHSG